MAAIGFKVAKCKDCYKCVRICPVKAIHIKNERVRYEAKECILCGQCLEACPQDAIVYVSDLNKVKQFLLNNEKIVVSLDPAYLGLLGNQESGPGKLRTALHKMGFAHIRETAEAATYVTKEYERLIQEGEMDNIITSSCTAVNEFVENYYPDMIPYMAPVVSPMTAHGMMLKEEYGPDVKVVYIGSCSARGKEAVRERCRGKYVDAILDFQELPRLFKQFGIDQDACEPSPMEGPNPKISSLYGISGGILTAIATHGKFGKYDHLSVDGIEDVQELFECIRKGELTNCFIEVSACVGGCINGPLTGGRKSDRFKARIYANRKISREFPEDVGELGDKLCLKRDFRKTTKPIYQPTEEEIQEALRKDGKASPEKQLNCGACGYKTCRDKAIALCQNKDQLNLCIPYKYQRVSSISDVILSVSTNLIITVDDQLRIIQFNEAAERMFNLPAKDAIGMKLGKLFNSEYYEKVLNEKRSILNKKIEYPKYGLITIQNIIYIEELNCALGIIRNITMEEKLHRQHDRMRMEAMEIAQKVIDKQMMVAQEIAGLLGETTAETKVTLTKMRDSIFYDGEIDYE
ncbi:[Fe-Fe] hydrogenase large subunit C-terminal domain-containing protein [Frisingicoccus sp.]|uniref:[Fe-Fe] hydrogenase large subunit C-terminal domain-containing protein n=1 Tax=Frisingicoccus sp. TaxID=1918627 RepID=UPI002EC511C1|nr:[Fe-Fe] hydrogenase large subunit C-terminal domain-containing protein [Frisingicoccus sp.]